MLEPGAGIAKSSRNPASQRYFAEIARLLRPALQSAHSFSAVLFALLQLRTSAGEAGIVTAFLFHHPTTMHTQRTASQLPDRRTPSERLDGGTRATPVFDVSALLALRSRVARGESRSAARAPQHAIAPLQHGASRPRRRTRHSRACAPPDQEPPGAAVRRPVICYRGNRDTESAFFVAGVRFQARLGYIRGVGFRVLANLWTCRETSARRAGASWRYAP
jgi:hypothetical protein